MPEEKRKTGQHIDALKEKVIGPTLADIIRRSIPEEQKEFALLEIGPGDGTSIKQTLSLLGQKNLQVNRLTLVESDRRVFVELAERVLVAPEYSGIDLTFMEPAVASIYGPLLEDSLGIFDIANAQMVFHQIPSLDLIGLYYAKTFMSLKDSRSLLITDLHPQYIKYLLQHEEAKISQVSENGYLYHYDSGGEQELFVHKLSELGAIGLETGFTVHRLVNHDISPLKNSKRRYATLLQKNVPMIYTLQLSKQEDRFLSYSEGMAERISRNGNFLHITFSDKTSREIPFTSDLPIENGDIVVIQQVKHPVKVNAVVTNVWVHKPGEIEKVKWYASAATLEAER